MTSLWRLRSGELVRGRLPPELSSTANGNAKYSVVLPQEEEDVENLTGSSVPSIDNRLAMLVCGEAAFSVSASATLNFQASGISFLLENVRTERVFAR